MEKLRAIIADDEPDALEVIANLLIHTSKVEVIAQIGESFKIESAINKHNPDVLFIDIEMPNHNGLEIIENIREYNQDLMVVFITAYDKYANEAIKLNVFSYLEKPVDRLELNQLIDNLYFLKENKQIKESLKKIKLPIREGYIYLYPKDLFVLEAEGNYTQIKTVTGEKFISSYNMGRLYEMLPVNGFFRINRHCIINGHYLFKVNKKQCICTAKVGNEEFEFEITKSFLSNFNRLLK